MKKIYRCLIIFHKYGKTGGGSMFVRAIDEKHAEEGVREIMMQTFKEHGYPETPIEVKVYPSSEEEITAYRAKMHHNSNADRMVN
jgi:hypothetical protein